MEIIISRILSFNFSSQLLVAAIFTVFSLFLTVLAVQSRKSSKSDGTGAGVASISRTCSCSCSSCNGTVESPPEVGAGEMLEVGRHAPAPAVAVAERGSGCGASMMEQLVPEITTHALSYLDYPSLCRLSMTNSLMRKAANDDNAWKALYHKDFTLEQDSVMPVNGWKAYYAATRAVVNVNAEFFNIIRERSLPAMGRLWLNADYVKCTHASGELFSGYNSVIQSWQLAFNWEQGVDFQVQDVKARVLTDMAWVTMKTYVDIETGPFNVTNVFEFHNGRWYMVHHHSSVMLIDGEVDQQVVHG
ncbi:hypothetical protein JRO89_XS13G0136500 [Xanthoceras sorbifolium]|uniref:F-box domain-containing protein n=1 Tax=Xanthoceras sorbifolium TaxID=99658 RepID=A0ABQ8H858_9ROSI|nr:hypothetical protein JRO89_XS13G0136500 [Xanthoceras sorbifolium]